MLMVMRLKNGVKPLFRNGKKQKIPQELQLSSFLRPYSFPRHYSSLWHYSFPRHYIFL